MNKTVTRFICMILSVSLSCFAPISVSAESTVLPDDCDSTPTYSIEIYAEPRRAHENVDHDSFTTEELVYRILDDTELMYTALYYGGVDDPYQAAKSISPTLGELETRLDADSILFDVFCELSEGTSEVNDAKNFVAILLSQGVLQDNLSTQQLQCLRTQASGSLDPGSVGMLVIDEPSIVFFDEITYNLSQTTASTFCGATICLYTATTEYTAIQRAKMRSDTLSEYDGIEAVGIPTTAYNSHSYAWYQQSSSNDYAIFNIDNYLSDAHTQRITVPEYMVGDIIVYYDSDGEIAHSAVVESVTDNVPTLVSKWGTNGLYRHSIEDVPAYYQSHFETGLIQANLYRLTTHTYRVTAKTAYNHTKTCSICADSYSEYHTVVNNRCTGCGYTGPFIEMSSVAPVEDPAVAAVLSCKRS